MYLSLFLAYNHYSNNLLIATSICYFYVRTETAKHRKREGATDGWGRELFLLSMLVAAML
jgi:hypothetical protein